MSQDAAKRNAAEHACRYVEDGMTVGLGTGSTADFMVRHLGERVAKGLRIRGVPTSHRTEELARKVGIPLATLDEVDHVDVTIDGADEVDPDLDLVKGLGGALLREKVVASITRRQVIVVDPSKLVPRLGTRSPLPVEVLPFGATVVARRLRERGLDPRLRVKDGRTFVTDNGNHVLDVHFPHGIADARTLERELNNTPGVVENGLFLGMTWKVVVGEADGYVREVDRRA
ncbi:MAG TPA: ribose-5-phosphate isomerase RpiA [Candidatus Thermoplasmatota archaeon]|nr:ribose-5-phosphate isomerase RpiA [Candidatus Thermoplasmatota archaeon]